MAGRELSHLQQLEAESIQIIREVAAEFDNPVMLYSIGKDSSVMLHLARKAFYPGKIPFPLLHVDTGWKFKEMIAFRDAQAKKFGFDAYAVSSDNPDPVANAMGRMLDHMHFLDNKVTELCQSVNKLGGNVCGIMPEIAIEDEAFIQAEREGSRGARVSPLTPQTIL